jgi:ABC-type Fe3+-hydroxamate transport system substrate-binding protein
MQFVDQLNRTIELEKVPQRIVSLVPSQTELLIYLGLKDKLVGITKFCIHPKNITRSIDKVGGTKNFKLDKIHSLNPDLIIANKEENEELKLKELMNQYPVWISDITNLKQATEMINKIGALTNKKTESINLSNEINYRFKKIKIHKKEVQSVLYLIWKNPFMSVNQNTFINNMLSKLGWHNVCSEYSNRYPEITEEDIKKLNPDIILLSSEPFPFKEKHKRDFQKLMPKSDVKIIDGEMFSWYGNKLLKSTDYFNYLLTAKK